MGYNGEAHIETKRLRFYPASQAHMEARRSLLQGRILNSRICVSSPVRLGKNGLGFISVSLDKSAFEEMRFMEKRLEKRKEMIP